MFAFGGMSSLDIGLHSAWNMICIEMLWRIWKVRNDVFVFNHHIPSEMSSHCLVVLCPSLDLQMHVMLEAQDFLAQERMGPNTGVSRGVEILQTWDFIMQIGKNKRPTVEEVALSPSQQYVRVDTNPP
eukprot:Gb_20568 [translate_table: standard]